jgi:uncharacterized damage-inducible protein DinB
MPTRSTKKKAPARKPAAKKPEPAPKKGAKEKVSKAAAGKAPRSAARAAKDGKAGSADGAAFDVVEALITSFATSNRISRFLIEALSEDVWHAAPPFGKGRTVAAIVCHMHNARVMWLESFGKSPKHPKKLDRLAATKEEALKALDLSHAAISKVVGASLKGDGRIANFKAGAASFLSYLMTHDAHHRGQICLMAKQLGHPLPQAVGYGMWEWSKR